jgi:hypothetical protein
MKFFVLVNEHCPIIHEQGFQLDSFTNEIKKIFFDLLNENQTIKNHVLELMLEAGQSARWYDHRTEKKMVSS